MRINVYAFHTLRITFIFFSDLFNYEWLFVIDMRSVYLIFQTWEKKYIHTEYYKTLYETPLSDIFRDLQVCLLGCMKIEHYHVKFCTTQIRGHNQFAVYIDIPQHILKLKGFNCILF